MEKQRHIKDILKDFYNKYPCGGDWKDGDARHVLLPWMSSVFEYALHSNKLLLDVGCGTGIDLLRYSNFDAKVIGIDISERPLIIAREKLLESGYIPSLILCDLERIPLKEGIFDLVYSNGVLHHTPDPKRGVQEIFRVIKPEKRAIVLIYHRYSLATLITKLNRAVYNVFTILGGSVALKKFVEFFMRREMNPAEVSAFREMWEHPLIKYFTKSEMKNIFKSVGFENVGTELFDAIYPLSRRFPRLNKIDVFENFFGRFLIIKAEKGRWP